MGQAADRHSVTVVDLDRDAETRLTLNLRWQRQRPFPFQGAPYMFETGIINSRKDIECLSVIQKKF